MAKDKHGRTLREGDIVLVEARVRQVHAGMLWANVSITPLVAMPPSHTANVLAVNGCQVELAHRPEPAEAACDGEQEDAHE
jgi:hypothetical protein